MALSASDFPIGVDDFEKLMEWGKVFVDKTGELKNLMESGADVTLLLRPSQFGTTLAMSMLQNFVELNYSDPDDRSRQERLFRNLNVYGNRKFCDSHMGRYPVVRISLRDVDGLDFEEAMGSMQILLSNLFDKYRFLLDSDKQDEATKKSLREKIEICSDDDLNLSNRENMSMLKEIVKDSLAFMSGMLYHEYGAETVFIVEDYDAPLRNAREKSKKKADPEDADFYDRMLEVVTAMLSLALKTNRFMKKGFVTGCLRIDHQSETTGFNNFDDCGIRDAHYSRLAGFTRTETEDLLKRCGMENRLHDVLTWYGGHNIGGREMICPWSLMKFLSEALYPARNPALFPPATYWVGSWGDNLVETFMKGPGYGESQRLQNLIDGKTEVIDPAIFTAYPKVNSDTDFDTFATALLHGGCFAYEGDANTQSREHLTIKIPNKEIRNLLLGVARRLFGRQNPEWAQNARSLRDALFSGEAVKVRKIINDMLAIFISASDSSREDFYHVFMTVALSAAGAKDMVMKACRESGDDRSNLILMRNSDRSAVVMRLKKVKEASYAAQDKACESAIEEISLNRYDSNLKQDGCERILKYGIAFRERSCAVKASED
ncbi:MAG: AAA family ATPase [Succinivibrionaceae bacterium]|nr:AAA family ATPase [Succinivibrionaceae bacterium]